MRRGLSVLLLLAILFFSVPNTAAAYPFGGQTSLVLPCFVFGFVPYGFLALLGPPNPGFYIWTPFTDTYPNGPPTHPGQWLLGQTSIPYICVISPIGPVIIPGITIAMMGSSQ